MIDSLFQQFGIDYLGPVDGHDMGELINALTTAKKLDHSVILHVKTIKGKGYPRAEQDKIGLYHGVPPFDLKKGILNKTNTHSQKWSESIANHIEYMMGKHDDICVITPAMISGSQLNHIFKSYPNRSFDVGIAEEHAMTFLAGLSVGGKFPFLSIYSSFFPQPLYIWRCACIPVSPILRRMQLTALCFPVRFRLLKCRPLA